MQMHTERGLIWVEAAYQSAERCEMDGYTYSFHSNELNADVYSKVLDELGHRRTFAIIEGYC